MKAYHDLTGDTIEAVTTPKSDPTHAAASTAPDAGGTEDAGDSATADDELNLALEEGIEELMEEGRGGVDDDMEIDHGDSSTEKTNEWVEEPRSGPHKSTKQKPRKPSTPAAATRKSTRLTRGIPAKYVHVVSARKSTLPSISQSSRVKNSLERQPLHRAY